MQLFAADVAFHEAGLNYSGKEETERRIIKKIIRTALCLICYFNYKSGEILFASPKVLGTFNPDKIKEETRRIFSAFNLNFEVKILCDEDFTSEIYDKVVERMSYSDTGELFVRAAQLINLMKPVKKEVAPTLKNPVEKPLKSIIDDPYPNMRIGEIASTFLRNELCRRIVPQNDLNNLQNIDFCKQHFKTRLSEFAILSKTPMIDRNGYSRSYANAIHTADGRTFYLTSQWFEESRQALVRYIQYFLQQLPVSQ